jgi:hypothetical protein
MHRVDANTLAHSVYFSCLLRSLGLARILQRDTRQVDTLLFTHRSLLNGAGNANSNSSSNNNSSNSLAAPPLDSSRVVSSLLGGLLRSLRSVRYAHETQLAELRGAHCRAVAELDRSLAQGRDALERDMHLRREQVQRDGENSLRTLLSAGTRETQQPAASIDPSSEDVNSNSSSSVESTTRALMGLLLQLDATQRALDEASTIDRTLLATGTVEAATQTDEDGTANVMDLQTALASLEPSPQPLAHASPEPPLPSSSPVEANQNHSVILLCKNPQGLAPDSRQLSRRASLAWESSSTNGDNGAATLRIAHVDINAAATTNSSSSSSSSSSFSTIATSTNLNTATATTNILDTSGHSDDTNNSAAFSSRIDNDATVAASAIPNAAEAVPKQNEKASTASSPTTASPSPQPRSRIPLRMRAASMSIPSASAAGGAAAPNDASSFAFKDSDQMGPSLTPRNAMTTQRRSSLPTLGGVSLSQRYVRTPSSAASSSSLSGAAAEPLTTMAIADGLAPDSSSTNVLPKQGNHSRQRSSVGGGGGPGGRWWMSRKNSAASASSSAPSSTPVSPAPLLPNKDRLSHQLLRKHGIDGNGSGGGGGMDLKADSAGEDAIRSNIDPVTKQQLSSERDHRIPG